MKNVKFHSSTNPTKEAVSRLLEDGWGYMCLRFNWLRDKSPTKEAELKFCARLN
jgi:hypothetical protein